MAQKKKKKTTSTTSAATTGSNATKPIQSNDFFLQEYFNMSDLIQKWKTKQIEAVSVLGAFQIALLSCREELDQSQQNISKQNIRMDPLLLEELYTQVSEITPNFEEILEQMYQVYGKAHDLVKKHHSFDCQGLKLSPLDQFQMISTQIAMYEAEYQHVETLFQMISFDMSNDQLQTIIIALGASPYIDARIIKDMQQVCTVLCYMMWVFSGISDGLLYRE